MFTCKILKLLKHVANKNLGECNTIIGTAVAASVQYLINSSTFILIILFVEMIKFTVDLQYMKPDKLHGKQTLLWVRHDWSANSNCPVSVSLGCTESVMVAYTAVMQFCSCTMSCTLKSTNEISSLCVLAKQNASKTSCGLGWCEHYWDTTLVLRIWRCLPACLSLAKIGRLHSSFIFQ